MSIRSFSGRAQAVPQMAQKIYSHSLMKQMGHKECSAIFTKFSPERCYSITSHMIMELRHHHIHEKTKRTWAARTDSLWWSCITMPDTTLKKRVLRSHAARKLKMSFVKSLERAGYARDGTRLPGSERHTDLCGSLQISARAAVLQMKDEELLCQTDGLVKAMHAAINKKGFGEDKSKGKKRNKDTNVSPVISIKRVQS